VVVYNPRPSESQPKNLSVHKVDGVEEAMKLGVLARSTGGKQSVDNYQQFRAPIMDWSDIAERAFLNSR
jgi:hypothetical protein